MPQIVKAPPLEARISQCLVESLDNPCSIESGTGSAGEDQSSFGPGSTGQLPLPLLTEAVLSQSIHNHGRQAQGSAAADGLQLDQLQLSVQALELMSNCH